MGLNWDIYSLKKDCDLDIGPTNTTEDQCTRFDHNHPVGEIWTIF